MKTKLLPILRYIVLALLLLCIVLCCFFPVMAEGYACHIYPWLSAALSAIASVFPFSLEEVLVVVIILWMIIYPFLKRRKKKSWRFIVGREVELLAWVYIWFYLGWGLNYFRYDIYRRMEVEPAGYDEQAFHRFLVSYTDSLNQSYTAEVKTDPERMRQEIKEIYRQVPSMYGLALPRDYQHPKQVWFNPLYSGVGVLGYMGPFFAESQLNEELLPVQLPFTYAHELSHLLGVSNEAEANYWAYRVCRSSKRPAVRYSAYFGLLPYVLVNASSVLTEEEFREWIKTIRPEVVKDYEYKRMYWNERYSTLLGEVQNKIYNLFLKGNNIPSGRKNYAEVIGILLSLEEKLKQNVQAGLEFDCDSYNLIQEFYNKRALYCCSTATTFHRHFSRKGGSSGSRNIKL